MKLAVRGGVVWLLALIIACSSASKDERIGEVQSALSACFRQMLFTTSPSVASWSPPWGRTQFIVPQNLEYGQAGATIRLSFTDSSTVNCDYACPPEGTACLLTGCDGPNGYGSGVFGTNVQMQFLSGPNGSQASARVYFTEDDGSVCTTDTCYAEGGIVHSPANSGAVCSTAQDLCHFASMCDSNGACIAGAALQSTWNDGNPCTGPDTCDPTRGIYGPPNGQCSLPSGASAGDSTIATDFSSGVAFIYNGGGQTGVQQNAIDSVRASVIRGRVLDGGNGNAPLGGVTVTALGQPQLGSTTTRSDGWFDMVVNGGGDVVVDFTGPVSPRFLRAQRTATTYWHDYTVVDDLILMRDQVGKTTIYRASNDWQTATGDEKTEGNITRKIRVLFPPLWDIDPTASYWSSPPTTSLTFGAVEYTAAPPSAMPADLPRQSGFTYAVELAFQEAVDAGINTVKFVPGSYKQAIRYTEPVLHPNDPENQPGKIVPTGSYNRATGRWVAEPNGRVIQIKSCTSGPGHTELRTAAAKRLRGHRDERGGA